MNLAGIYAASITPLLPDYSLDLSSVQPLLDFFYRRGCHGALLFGTTGEGPSFSPDERLAFLKEALTTRQQHAGFRLLAGTGTPSLEETISLTRAAFDLEIDGVVVLPPYYFRSVNDDGLFAWFSEVLRKAVPPEGVFLGYHIPKITGVNLSIELLARLKDAFPDQFTGIKDSSGDALFSEQLGKEFGKELLVLTGNDILLNHALEHNASGCITAMANLCSPDSRRVWDSFHSGRPDAGAQERLIQARKVLDRYPPAPPFVKALLAKLYDFPAWSTRPPLLPLPNEIIEKVADEFALVG